MSTHEDFDAHEEPDEDILIEGAGGGKVFAGCDPEGSLRGCTPGEEHMPHFAVPDSNAASTTYVVGKRIAFHEYMQYKISEGRAGAD